MSKKTQTKKVQASRNKAKDVKGPKMELSVKDRLLLTGHLLPKQGNIIDITVAADIRQKVELTQADFKKYDVKSDGSGGLTWKEPKQGKSVVFSDAEMELMKVQVVELDKAKKITPELLQLCLMVREG